MSSSRLAFFHCHLSCAGLSKKFENDERAIPPMHRKTATTFWKFFMVHFAHQALMTEEHCTGKVFWLDDGLSFSHAIRLFKMQCFAWFAWLSLASSWPFITCWRIHIETHWLIKQRLCPFLLWQWLQQSTYQGQLCFFFGLDLGPEKCYLDHLEWIEVGALVFIPLLVSLSVTFAFLSQIARFVVFLIKHIRRWWQLCTSASFTDERKPLLDIGELDGDSEP